MTLEELRINGRRLQSTLAEMARIGATPGGGVQRLALSDEDRAAIAAYLLALPALE
jgi:N-carbamoyl-L-amino-acid hydrolase